uniref:DUF996 domain-containing protein n=1 Tax=Thermofilum adornatum TaxID=1365176 RepID=A0A7C1G9U0_9CREN
MEQILPNVSSLLIKIGAIIALILGLFKIIQGIIILLFSHGISALLGTLFPAASTLINLIPIGGTILAAIWIILGAIIAAIGFALLKIPVPISQQDRGKWVGILAVLLALALIFGSGSLAAAIGIALLGLVLAPATPTPPPTKEQK